MKIFNRISVVMFGLLWVNFASASVLPSKAIKFNGEVVSPTCLAAFLPSMENSEIKTTIINPRLCSHSGYKVNEKGTLLSPAAYGGFIGYASLGQTSNAIKIIDFVENGGGSGVFETILLIQELTLDLTAFDVDSPNTPNSTPFTYLNLVGIITLGDRCTGGLKDVSINKNKLIVTQYNGTNAADCSKEIKKQYDLDKLNLSVLSASSLSQSKR